MVKFFTPSAFVFRCCFWDGVAESQWKEYVLHGCASWCELLSSQYFVQLAGCSLHHVQDYLYISVIKAHLNFVVIITGVRIKLLKSIDKRWIYINHSCGWIFCLLIYIGMLCEFICILCFFSLVWYNYARASGFGALCFHFGLPVNSSFEGHSAFQIQYLIVVFIILRLLQLLKLVRICRIGRVLWKELRQSLSSHQLEVGQSSLLGQVSLASSASWKSVSSGKLILVYLKTFVVRFRTKLVWDLR